MASAQVTVFERALERFKGQLAPDELRDFAGTTLGQLEITLAAIQRKHARSLTMKNITRIRGFLEAMKTYAQVLDVFVNVNDFVAFIWKGPMKYLLIVAHNFTEAFNALLDAYKRISECLPVLEQYQAQLKLYQDQYEQHQDQIRKVRKDYKVGQVLEMTFNDIFDFHREALKYFKGSIWRQVFRSTWNTFETRFRPILDNLQYHKGLVERQATLCEFQEACAHRERTLERFKSQEAQELANRRIHVLTWLSAADVEVDQTRGADARAAHRESGRWLLARDAFRAWYDPRSSSAPLLWIWGIPGAGKSVLASLVVEEAQKLSSTVVPYFYFRHDDPGRNTFVSMARALIKDLSSRDDLLLNHVFSAAISKGELCLKTRRLAEELLNTCVSAVGAKYFVIDGLDECEELEQKHVASWLRKHVEDSMSEPEPSRCVFLSQYDASTKALLGRLPSLRITAQDNTADIQAYCTIWSRRIQQRFGLDDAYAGYIATGMFLFARLVMQNLFDQISLDGLNQEMSPHVFPAGLEDAYQRILNRVLHSTPGPHRQCASQLLSWLVCALRPLQWREIQGAIAIDVDRGVIEAERRRWVVSAEALCGALVERSTDGTVQLVHSTARFYLQKMRYVDVTDEHLRMAQLCLEYFCMAEFSNEGEDEDVDDALQQGCYAFLDYAVVSWTKHAEIALKEPAQVSLLSSLEESLTTFFECAWKDPQEHSEVPPYVAKIVQALGDEQLRERTLKTFASMHMSLSADIPKTEPFHTNSTLDMLYRIRDRTEIMAEDVADPQQMMPALHRYYGERLFKCTRVYCKHFHEGFKTAQDRETHLQRHERPFFCPEPSCHIAALGCATQKELNGHMAMYHAPVFPTGPDSTSASIIPKTKRSNDGKYPCDRCVKRFRSEEYLKAHHRIHTTEKAFSCPTCQKKFRRKADVTRHEMIHRRFGTSA